MLYVKEVDMTGTSLYPVLLTDDVAGVAGFFVEHLAFAPTFELDWYVSLARDGAELAVLHRDHETIPDGFRGASSAAVLVNIEVDDVVAEHARLTAAGLEPVQALRTEGFGQRHAIFAGPGGVLIDVIQVVPYDEEHAAAAR
jgi:hypothetical protein